MIVKRSFVGLLFVTGFMVGLLTSAQAGHLTNCIFWDFYVDGYRLVQGDDTRNHCFGGDGKQQIEGFAEGDELGGGKGDDRLQGAYGSDDLTDGQGSSDIDKVCDGGDADYVAFEDADDLDHWHWNEDFGDVWGAKDRGDTRDIHASCPF